jgi:pimeloyl-ACP methyl ester carboxylesterase
MAPPLQRLADAALYAVAPGVGVRTATDAFSRTRDAPAVRDDLLPLHARGFEVPGQPRVPRGYRWPGGDAVAVLLHGWRADSSSMFPLVDSVRGEGYTAVAFDAPGHGSSRGDLATITEYAEAAEAVVRAAGEVRILVAHSLGAIAAAAAWARTGAPVDGVVFVAPTCTLTGVLERWRPEAIRITPERKAGIYRELHRRNGTPVSYWDVSTLAPDLACPVLAIHDPDDPVVPFSETEAIAAALPQTEILEAPGCGHYAILMSAEVKRAVADFAGALERVA